MVNPIDLHLKRCSSRAAASSSCTTSTARWTSSRSTRPSSKRRSTQGRRSDERRCRCRCRCRPDLLRHHVAALRGRRRGRGRAVQGRPPYPAQRKRGYSKNGREDAPQTVIGLAEPEVRERIRRARAACVAAGSHRFAIRPHSGARRCRPRRSTARALGRRCAREAVAGSGPYGTSIVPSWHAHRRAGS